MNELAEQSKAQQLKALFESALDLAPDARALFLQTQTDDAELLNAALELLRAHQQAGGFLAAPPLFDRLRVPREAAAGQRLGPYRLLREIGRGGMATVYLAERDDEEFQQQVAIKLLWPRAESAEIVRRFRQERQILARLNHPHIARLLDGGTNEQGWPYLVMEYIEGMPFTQYCNTLRLSVPARLRLFQTVCTAVAYAHQHLVIHRDLKPSNILVTKDGTVKLLDFGIAKMLAPDTSGEARTRTDLQWMTPEYASPEQLREEPISTASDVYSLGVLLYELLTGAQPHAVRDRPLHEIIRVVSETAPLPPSTCVAERLRGIEGMRDEGRGMKSSGKRLFSSLIPHPFFHPSSLKGDLDNIILKTLRKEPEQRYASVEELRADLARHLTGEPVKARQPTLSYRAGKFIRRHPTGVAVSVTLLLALLAAFGYAIHQARQAREQARLQRQANYAAQLRQASAAWFDNDPRGYDEILQSPPVLPQSGEEDLRGLEWRYLWRLGHRERLSFAQTDGSDFRPSDKGGELFTWQNSPLRFTLRDALTGQTLAERQLSIGAATVMQSYLFSPNRAAVLYQTDGRTLLSLDVLSGARQPLLDDPSPMTCLVVNDENGLVTGHTNGQVKRWERQTGRFLSLLATVTGQVRAAELTPDNARLVTLTTNNTLQLFELPQQRELLRLENVASFVSRWNPRRWLVVDSDDNSISVYDLYTARKLSALDTRNNPTVFVAGQSQYPLAVGHQDNTVRLYDLPSLRLLSTLTSHQGWANTAMLSADSKRLLTASSDRTVKLWDVAKQQELATLRGHHDDVVAAHWFDQDRQLASISRDHVLKIWDVAEVLRPDVLTSRHGKVFSIAFAPDGRLLASANQDGTITLWDVETGTPIKTLSGHTGQVLCVKFSPDSQRLVSSSEDRIPRVWEVASGKPLFELCCHAAQQHFAAFSPDGKWIASASDDSTVKLWDTANGRLIHTLPVPVTQSGRVQNLWSLAFAPDSRTLLSGTDKGELRLWDVANGQSRAVFHPHGDTSIWSIAFTPDGQHFATASGDSTAKLWRTATRELVRTFKGHSDGLFELAFSPDGQRLVTASRDKTVRFWNVATGAELFSLKGHSDAVWSVAFAPDGNMLASGSWDGTVRLWRAAAEKRPGQRQP